MLYEEGVAYHFGLRRRCDCGNNVVLSVRAGGKRRPAIELRNQFFVPCVDRVLPWGRQHSVYRYQARCTGARRSLRTCACVAIPNARTGNSHRFPVQSPERPGTGTVSEPHRG